VRYEGARTDAEIGHLLVVFCEFEPCCEFGVHFTAMKCRCGTLRSAKRIYQKNIMMLKQTPSTDQNTSNSENIYLRTAVVINLPEGGVGVRVTTLQECGNKRNIQLRIGDLHIKLLKTTVHKKCPWSFAPRCNLVGYFATGIITSTANQTVPLPSVLPELVEVYDDRQDEWKYVDLVDGRSTAKKMHRLAVCLQPVNLMADWPLIPNFFETWIGNGATIFYVYVHSISEEVDLMLKLYEDQYDIEVARVDWPTVPTEDVGADDDLNPNNRMYRTEVATAVNDCLLRARATAELAVSSDMDEIITPMNLKGKNETLFNIIDDYRNRKLKNGAVPGAFLFRHSYAYVENNWFSIAHPSDLSFHYYRNVSYEQKVWARGYRSKVVVYVPDRVFRGHVHDTVSFERKQWATVVIDPNRARVLHFRQIASPAMQRAKVVAGSVVLREAAARWQAEYTKRVDTAVEQAENGMPLKGAFDLSFASLAWPNLGEQVLKEIEQCREENYKIRKDKCVTEQRCRSTMQTVQPD
ncbi:hypothetical protein PRIPAC_80049, partial [Pristionchus pacificus]|uniref:Glycosyltransferase family 92 protein n=1 Tax=Pristionchus pacificus TaxID=54126 RepID=A0A2A6CQA1_PRIPA